MTCQMFNVFEGLKMNKCPNHYDATAVNKSTYTAEEVYNLVIISIKLTIGMLPLRLIY